MNLYLIPTTYLNPIALINSNFKSNCITFSFGINPSDALNNARATLISLDLDIAAQYDLSPKCEMYLWIPENKILLVRIIQKILLFKKNLEQFNVILSVLNMMNI